MTETPVRERSAASDSKVSALTILAFGAIYVLWGSTYFAIRVAVSEMPPLQAAGVRFAIAGALLILWTALRGTAKPTLLEWRNAAILSVFMFLIDYAFLFWAEKNVPSGIASVLVSIIPIWTVLFEVLVFKRERWNLPVMLAMAAGLAGVVLLTGNTVSQHVPLAACLGLFVAGLSWALGTGLSKTLALPASKPQSAGMQMLIGGVLLLICSLLLREPIALANIHRDAIAALAYLIVVGSIVSFTAYVWLLSRYSATVVSSYAYVNPVVALALGHWLGNEILTWKSFAAATLVILSVATILKTKKAH